MLRSITRPLVALSFWMGLGASASADQTHEWSMKIVIGKKAPLADACYENARDAFEDYEALEPCNLSLENEPLMQRRRAGVYANRGVIYYNIGEYESAIEDFTASLDLNINVVAKVRTNRGLAYEALGYEALARTDYIAALNHDPDYADASDRLKELEKPIYDRSRLPRKIRVEAPAAPVAGILRHPRRRSSSWVRCSAPLHAVQRTG